MSGGFSANLLPGQLDALLFGITEAAAESIAPAWDANIAGNWYFIAAMTLIFLPVIWFVTDVIIEPRMGKYVPEGSSGKMIEDGDKPITPEQKKGLRRALYATIIVCLLWVGFTFGPGTPLDRRSGGRPGAIVAVLQVARRRIPGLVSGRRLGLWRRRWNGEKPPGHCGNDERRHG